MNIHDFLGLSIMNILLHTRTLLHIREPIFVTEFGRWLCFCCFVRVIFTSITI